MRPLAPLALLVSAVIGTSTASAATAPRATTQIVQQRLSDGRILLTDTPVRGATTERSWQVPAGDPGAAQRAREVTAEAERVSERIQRLLDQERRADEENVRMRIASLEMEQQRERRFDDEGVTVGFGTFAPWAGQRFHSRFDDRFFHGHDHFGHRGRFHPGPHRSGSGSGAMLRPGR